MSRGTRKINHPFCIKFKVYREAHPIDGKVYCGPISQDRHRVSAYSQSQESIRKVDPVRIEPELKTVRVEWRGKNMPDDTTSVLLLDNSSISVQTKSQFKMKGETEKRNRKVIGILLYLLKIFQQSDLMYDSIIYNINSSGLEKCKVFMLRIPQFPIMMKISLQGNQRY